MITRLMALTTATPTAAPQGQSAPSPLRGILLIMASTGFFAVSDVITKQLTAALPAGEVAWMRYAVFVLLVLPTVALNGGSTLLRSHRPGLQSTPWRKYPRNKRTARQIRECTTRRRGRTARLEKLSSTHSPTDEPSTIR